MLYKALQSLVVAAYLLSFLRSSEGLQSPFDAAHNPSHDLETSAETISAALAEASQDPAAALLSLRPDLKTFVDEPRLLLINVEGIPQQRWMTEGDKFRLKRRGETFIDITEHGDWSMQSMRKQKARKYSFLFSPLTIHRNTPTVTSAMDLPTFPGGVGAANDSIDGERDLILQSLLPVPTWRQILSVASRRHLGCYRILTTQDVHLSRVSHPSIPPTLHHCSVRTIDEKCILTNHNHRRSSGLAQLRLPIVVRDLNMPNMTDSYARPAPGADDDLSGSISTLEAFTVLAGRGYIPREGPVEFHWYAAEEGGLLGSQDVVAYHREQCGIVGAMIEFVSVDLTISDLILEQDMTGWTYKGPNATNVVMIDETDADPDLTAWLADLVTEYIDIPPHVRQVPSVTFLGSTRQS